MALKTEERLINERTVTVTQLPGRRGLAMQVRLAKLLAPLIDGGLLKNAAKLKDMDVLDPSFMNIVQKFVGDVEPDEFVSIVTGLLSTTRIDNVEVTETYIDMNLANDYVFLYRVVAFAIQVNFGSFFALGGIGSRASE